MRHPFQIVPVAPGRLYVAHGYVNHLPTQGCLDTDGEGTRPRLVEVPKGAHKFPIWVEVKIEGGRVVGNELQFGAEGWPGFPKLHAVPGRFFFQLGYIDAPIGEALRVRQMALQDFTLLIRKH